MYLVKVSDLLQMRGAPEPHQKLKMQGLLHEWHPGMFTIFVSHQWLSASHPDPDGKQLAVLREAFERIITKQLQVEEDLVSFPVFKSLSKRDRDAIAGGFVFFDWFAIPQLTARVAGINEDLQRSDAAKAVQSIPGYVEAADLFLALVPETLHSNGSACNYATWLSRGWCRAEWWCHLLSNKKDPSVIIIYSAKEAEFMFPLNWQQHTVSTGHFTVESDREVVMKLSEKALENKMQLLHRTGDLRMYRYLLAHRPRLLAQDLGHSDREMKEFLMDFCFDSLEDAVKEQTPMTGMLCAIFAGDVQMVQRLVECRADVNARMKGLNHLGYSDTQTLLMAATKSNQKAELLQALIDLKADVHARTRVGLNCSFVVRSAEHVEVLLKARADLLSECLPMGLTPLTGAVVWSTHETVLAMLEARCDPNPPHRGVGYGPLLGLTFLRARMSLDSAELAMTLLRFRADVNAKATPADSFRFIVKAANLHAAIMGGLEDSSILKRLLVSLPGLTPLGGAAFVGNEALAKIFLQHDAEITRNDHGELPEDLARLNGHVNLLELLQTFTV